MASFFIARLAEPGVCENRAKSYFQQEQAEFRAVGRIDSLPAPDSRARAMFERKQFRRTIENQAYNSLHSVADSFLRQTFAFDDRNVL